MISRDPTPNVTPLRPIDALAAQLDSPPIVAGPLPQAPADDWMPDPKPAADLPLAEPGGKRSGGDRPRGQIWRDCPVKPLGVNGNTSYYLDVHGQLRAVAKHDAQSLMHLYGHMIPQLCWNFAQWVKDPDSGAMSRKPGRFDQTNAAMAHIEACSEKGLFDPENAVRGVGAWADDEGNLIYHTGDRMIIDGAAQDPATHHGRIYPARPPIPHPALPGKHPDPVPELLELLATWKWKRPDIDAMIALGLIGVQAFGGALDWRPAYWFTGGPGTGKSALQRLLGHLHGGDQGIIQSTDTTARGIASLLGQSTLPVALDELEPGDQGSSRERDIIQTARVAASGGRWVRGSSDQKGSTGQLRSTFLFSSILVPGVLKSQDLQRIIVLSLNPFAEGTRAPVMPAATWRRRGAVLKRMIIDRWHSWPARMEAWRVAFAAHGIDGRNADNWATTMAMAQMMQSEAMPQPDELAGWTAKVAAWIKADLGEAGSDATEVLTHLLSQEYDVFRKGERFTVAQWVMVAAGSPGAPPGLLDGWSNDLEGQRKRSEQANRALAKAHIKVVADGRAPPRLWVGNSRVRTLLDLFDGSAWAGGAWKQSLERVKGATTPNIARTLAGEVSRGVEIPLASIPGLMAGPDEDIGGTVHSAVATASIAPSEEGFY